MDRPNASSEGSLLELVARGQKDKYFMNEKGDAVVPFSYDIKTWPATIDETRQTQPLNMVDFGRTVEWEMDCFGDTLVAAALVIDLPTWLPISVAPLNTTTVISDASGTTYGYTQGVGAFLFEKIQFYQDQLLLQEFSGDFLYAWAHLQGTLGSEALAMKEMGGHGGSALEIQRNATPGRLYLRLPLIGCSHPDDSGLPFVSLPDQKYRIRCSIRRLEDLVESSSGAVKPTPWNRIDLTSRAANGLVTAINPLSREAIVKPLITLETTQRYVRPSVQSILRVTANKIPFLRPFENILSLDSSDYIAVGNGQASFITKRIDGRHPAEGLLIMFQSQYYADRNQLWNLVNPMGDGTYYNRLKLLVAGKEREKEWDSTIWQGLSPLYKCEKCPGIPVSWISFTVGPSYGYRAPEKRKPSGTLNFSSADRPTLWMSLNDTLPSTSRQQKRVTMRVITVGWGVYDVKENRGTLAFAN